MREFLKGLELDPETIDKIMGKMGSQIEIDKSKDDKISDLEAKIVDLKRENKLEN